MDKFAKRAGGKPTVLYLTNNNNALGLYSWLEGRCNVSLYDGRVSPEFIRSLKPDWAISYNYKYIIGEEIIHELKNRIVNLHISYLPWNRGSDPNFWSFVEDTPKGVTIHQISKGLDEGRILCQEACVFDPSKETFETTYRKLNEQIVRLFQKNWEAICSGGGWTPVNRKAWEATIPGRI